MSEKLQVREAAIAFVAENPDVGWRDLYTGVPNHYQSPAAMRGGIGSIEELRMLAEARIKQAPQGVTTDSRQQEILQSEGRGVAQMGGDVIMVTPSSMIGSPQAVMW